MNDDLAGRSKRERLFLDGAETGFFFYSPCIPPGHSVPVAIMVDKPVVDVDGAAASDTVKNVESGYVSTKPQSHLDQFEDPDQGLSAEERAKKVSDP